MQPRVWSTSLPSGSHGNAVRLAQEPPDAKHHYGHNKITFISAAVEGSLICIAGIVIIITATERIITGVEIQELGIGMTITAAAGGVNALLGMYLIKTGKREESLAVEANGRHVMTDVWTSLGAVGGLLLAKLTGFLLLDPIVAILFALNILREGVSLVVNSAGGLMDKTDPEIEKEARRILDLFVAQHGLQYHRLRLRMNGRIPHIDFHMLFPDDMSIQSAHALATEAERQIETELQAKQVEVFTHLEPSSHPSDHD